MPRYNVKWKGEFCRFWMRHMPVELHQRIKVCAARNRTSMEVVMIQAAEIGLRELEKKGGKDGKVLGGQFAA